MILKLLLIPLLFLSSFATDSKVTLDYIREKSEIRTGGTRVFKYDETFQVVSVAVVAVGTKSELDCAKVGSAKAKKEMLSYINGSDISSYTELRISETEIDTLQGRKVEAKQEYVEVIRETVLGSINECLPLGGWFSEDGGTYYYAIYKIIR